MIMNDPSQKVTADHLRRDAYLYIRQSTLRQVLENSESTKRQYALRQRAIALGWPDERIVVIDNDLGQSGASAADREGFQKLVAEVSMEHVGIVLGLEVSRLARNCSDWHRLLELCAMTGTLILDEDGCYDPADFNDALLLGIKGTMSAAELHLLKARLHGGIANKARRGELKNPLPVGLVYDSQDRVVRDPDRQVQETLENFFRTFERVGSASGTVKRFAEERWLFPKRIHGGPNRGELVWGELFLGRALQLLHNPRYAGTFVHGRSRTIKSVDGRSRQRRLPQQEWGAVLLEAHQGYITWEQFQHNQQRLRENGQAHGVERRKSPPGEGPALLQGLAMCGLCGERMTVRYHHRSGRLVPEYVCQREGIEHARPICQRIPGTSVDEAIGELLLEKMTPVTLNVAWAVGQELESRQAEADALRRQQVERARYEAEAARARYMEVDPKNRLVADSLEGDWNDKLRAAGEAQERYEQQRESDRTRLEETAKQELLSLATDFPRLWRDEKTSHRDRKRIVRLLIEDVTLVRDPEVVAKVRLKGGAWQTLNLGKPLRSWETWQTDPKVIEEIDRLLNDCTDTEVATRLNQDGFKSGKERSFTTRLVARLRRQFQLKSRYDRLREAGMLTEEEIAEALGVHFSTVRHWRNHGLLLAHPYNAKNECLYEPPGDDRPMKQQGVKLSDRRPRSEDPSSNNERGVS
jgi:DNA invertase Pin-like site-specific DNA recombinase